METSLYKIVDICIYHQVESTFVYELYHNGLIEIITQENDDYLHESQLLRLEKFRNLHYDLELNIQGLEIVDHLLEKINYLQKELQALKTYNR